MGMCNSNNYDYIPPTEEEILGAIEENFAKNNGEWAKFELDIITRKSNSYVIVYIYGTRIKHVMYYIHFLQYIDKIMKNNNSTYITHCKYYHQNYYSHRFNATKNKYIFIEITS